MGKREENAIQTKTKIIEAAKTLIRENGIDNVSVDDITKLAGVAKGSYYVYFKKKEDIVGAIGCMEFRYINEELSKMDNLDIVSKLKYYFIRYKEGVKDLGVEISKCWLQNNLNCRCKLEYDFNSISSIIRIAVEKKELKEDTNISSLTYKIISILYGLMLIWIMADGSFNLDENIDNINIKELLFPCLVEVQNERI